MARLGGIGVDESGALGVGRRPSVLTFFLLRASRGTANSKKLGVTALSRNLSNVPGDPLMKGLGCNVRAIGPNDGAQALVEFYAGEIGRV